LLTAKLSAKELTDLKAHLLRPGFVEEWNHLDAAAAEFAKVLLSKDNAAPSATYTLFTTYAAEAVLWLGFTTKQAAVKEKYENFLKVWPQARQKVPYALMLEMRITPELPIYADLVKSIFLQLIDGGLTSTEELKALLEPHSPPAPPPPVTIKRTRAKKGADAKSKARLDDDDEEDSDDLEDDGEDEQEDDDLDGLDLGGDDLDLGVGLDGGRAPLAAADGEEDDVFARDTVGDDDLDVELDSDVDPDSDDEADRDNDDDDPPPTRKVAKKKIASRRSASGYESERDASSAAGAGLKALALELDLEEPADPADLDESDPIFDLEEDEPVRPVKASAGKAAKAPPAKSAPLKPAKAKPAAPAKKR
jgi:tRNA nucleotidyltransferase (CCA-adding enzyme)